MKYVAVAGATVCKIKKTVKAGVYSNLERSYLYIIFNTLNFNKLFNSSTQSIVLF